MKLTLQVWPDPRFEAPQDLLDDAIMSIANNPDLKWTLTTDDGVVIADDVQRSDKHDLVAQFWIEPGREFPLEGMDGVLYEKCAHCHLAVEPNDAWAPDQDIAKYIHLSRGDDMDERYEDHNPTPSGMVATLRTWMVYGPSLMRERFHIK